MTKNNRLPKKQENVPARTEVQIDPGNVSVLTVKLLNDINNNLIEIKKALQNE